MWLRTVTDDLVLSLALPSALLLKQALRQVTRHNIGYHYQTIHLHPKKTQPSLLLSRQWDCFCFKSLQTWNILCTVTEVPQNRTWRNPFIFLEVLGASNSRELIPVYERQQFSYQNLRVLTYSREGSLTVFQGAPLYMYPACSPARTWTQHPLCMFMSPHQLKASYLFQS